MSEGRSKAERKASAYNRQLYVDARWRGNTGIGRYSSEVLKRLTIPHRKLVQITQPSSPVDVIDPSRAVLSSKALMYSPGYNAGFSRARQVLTLHDLIHLRGSGRDARLKRLYYDQVVKPAVRRTGSVLTVSETSAELIREWLSDDEVEVRNAGNGCSGVFFEEYEDIREPDHYLYVGNLKEHKNVDVMFGALALRPDLRLTAVVSDAAAALGKLSSIGLQSRVRILSNVSDEDLAKLYRRSTALVMPSLLEGFGLPAAEALATRTPVCFWKGCASVAEIVGRAGFAVADAYDPEEWATAFDRVASIPIDSVDRTRVKIGYSWSMVAKRIQEHLYEMA